MTECQFIDLALYAQAHRLLEKLVDRRGIRWFLDPAGRRLMALDPTKVDLVARLAVRARARAGARHDVTEDSVGRCRKQIRRALIARIAHELVAAGC